MVRIGIFALTLCNLVPWKIYFICGECSVEWVDTKMSKRFRWSWSAYAAYGSIRFSMPNPVGYRSLLSCIPHSHALNWKDYSHNPDGQQLKCIIYALRGNWRECVLDLLAKYKTFIYTLTLCFSREQNSAVHFWSCFLFFSSLTCFQIDSSTTLKVKSLILIPSTWRRWNLLTDLPGCISYTVQYSFVVSSWQSLRKRHYSAAFVLC